MNRYDILLGKQAPAPMPVPIHQRPIEEVASVINRIGDETSMDEWIRIRNRETGDDHDVYRRHRPR